MLSKQPGKIHLKPRSPASDQPLIPITNKTNKQTEIEKTKSRPGKKELRRQMHQGSELLRASSAELEVHASMYAHPGNNQPAADRAFFY